MHKNTVKGAAAMAGSWTTKVNSSSCTISLARERKRKERERRFHKSTQAVNKCVGYLRLCQGTIDKVYTAVEKWRTPRSNPCCVELVASAQGKCPWRSSLKIYSIVLQGWVLLEADRSVERRQVWHGLHVVQVTGPCAWTIASNRFMFLATCRPDRPLMT